MIHGISSKTRVLLCALPLLTACAQTTPPPASDTTRIEQQLNDIERRVELLESRPQVQAPLRTREDILEHRERLTAERVRLMTRMTDQHPAIRDIDRQLRILDLQLKSIEP